MLKAISSQHPPRHSLLFSRLWLALMIVLAFMFPARIAAQESRNAASDLAAPTAPFDELHRSLEDAADRLLAAPVSPPVARETAIVNATPAQSASPRQETTKHPSRAQSAARIERLRPVIDPILRGEGIPTEMVAVALMESGGQAAALSPKGARGIWQLMPETARRYGLVVSAQRDDRLDLVSATRAAARYLRDLQTLFGNWELVLAAYNAGEQAVQSAIQRAGSNRFAVLSQLRLLPAETRNYVPAVMGARGLFMQTTVVAGESTSVANLSKAGRPAQNITGGKVFYAMNAPDSQIAAERPEAQDATSSMRE